MSNQNFSYASPHAKQWLILICVLAFAGVALGQKEKAKADLTGSYEGTAKNKAEEVIKVTFD